MPMNKLWHFLKSILCAPTGKAKHNHVTAHADMIECVLMCIMSSGGMLKRLA